MENNEIYYVSEKTYGKLYDFCATRLLAAEMKITGEPFANTGYFKRASSEFGSADFFELGKMFADENVPADALETLDNCPDDLLPVVVRETLQKFVVGRGENISPGTQLVSKETFFYILADIAETLLYEFTKKHETPDNGDVKYEFYDWFNERINTNSKNISEMIVRDGSSPKLIVDLCNRAEDFEELIVEIFKTYRVKPF